MSPRFMKKLRKAFFSLTKDLYDKSGHKNIKKNKELYNTLVEYLKSTESTELVALIQIIGFFTAT